MMPRLPAVTMPPHAAEKPRISVIVPFLGDHDDALALIAALEAIELADGDEIILVDNTPGGAIPAGELTSSMRLLADTRERSSYYARNAGAAAAGGEWLLFVDSDCRPVPGILAEYRRDPLPERCGLVAGGVVAAASDTLAGRYAASRGLLDERVHVDAERPAGITANMLVRRAPFEALGGFHEGVVSGADVEFSWRLLDAGWEVAHRPEARVHHVHPDAIGAIVRKARRYGAGRRWVNRLHPGSMPRPGIAYELVRAAGGALVWTVTGRLERALFKLVDGRVVVADQLGYLVGDNRASRERTDPPRSTEDRGPLVVLTDAYPARSETFIFREVDELKRLGWLVRVESTARPPRIERQAARHTRIDYLEDEPPGSTVRDLGGLVARHPWLCLADLLARRRWRHQEIVFPLRAIAPLARRLRESGDLHVHIHFAGGAALHGLRIHRLTGVPYSLVAHGYDVFQKPANLPEKLANAAFVVGNCDYFAEHLAERLPVGANVPVRKVVMGVDPDEFRRTTPYPGGRSVAAVGRLVPKKGFADLVAAAAILKNEGRLDRLVIAGEGPLRDELLAAISAAGLEEVAQVRSAWGSAAVRELLEAADLLAMPAVVAPDGDRDSMPVVVKEAMAMELPVVATREVGLPELVDPGWGMLVPPGDPEALAAAIGEVLDLPADRRAAMGAAGRARVLERYTIAGQTARLSEYLAAAIAGG